MDKILPIDIMSIQGTTPNDENYKRVLYNELKDIVDAGEKRLKQVTIKIKALKEQKELIEENKLKDLFEEELKEIKVELANAEKESKQLKEDYICEGRSVGKYQKLLMEMQDRYKV